MTLQAPPPDLVEVYIDFYRYLIPRLQFLLERFPQAVPTSWWRSERRNLAVGGAPYSQHLLGWAVDFAPPRHQNRELVRLANEIGLVGVDEGDHVHVQMYPAGVIPKTVYVKIRSI